MKYRNKKEVQVITGNYVKIGEKCKDCVHSDESTLSVAKIKCACNKPKTIFQPKVGWICYSFSQKMPGNNENEVKINVKQ